MTEMRRPRELSVSYQHQCIRSATPGRPSQQLPFIATRNYRCPSPRPGHAELALADVHRYRPVACTGPRPRRRSSPIRRPPSLEAPPCVIRRPYRAVKLPNIRPFHLFQYTGGLAIISWIQSGRGDHFRKQSLSLARLGLVRCGYRRGTWIMAATSWLTWSAISIWGAVAFS